MLHGDGESRSTFILILTSVLKSLVLFAYLRVLIVSSRLPLVGEMLAIMIVMQLPSRESLRILVNLESLKGMCFYWFKGLLQFSWSMLMQFPKERRDLLMLQPSNILLPVLRDLAPLSEPARSIMVSLPIVNLFLFWISHVI